MVPFAGALRRLEPCACVTCAIVTISAGGLRLMFAFGASTACFHRSGHNDRTTYAVMPVAASAPSAAVVLPASPADACDGSLGVEGLVTMDPFFLGAIKGGQDGEEDAETWQSRRAARCLDLCQ